ncbi:MAG: nitroreductase family protein [Spirochaetota bacterium]|nr:nitroreductase family protein [Spirochaetota bacterium]
MTLSQILTTRRSIRAFKPQKPSDQLITELIDAAIQAPSASNSQPWRFLVIKDPSSIQAMRVAVEEASQHILGLLDPQGQKLFKEYGKYFIRFADAPVVIAPIFKVTQILSNFLPDNLPDVTWMESQSAVISISLSVQNLLLMAHEKSLGASVMTGPLIANTALTKILSIPDKWHLAMLIPLGYPAEDPDPTSRKPAHKMIRWIQ